MVLSVKPSTSLSNIAPPCPLLKCNHEITKIVLQYLYNPQNYLKDIVCFSTTCPELAKTILGKKGNQEHAILRHVAQTSPLDVCHNFFKFYTRFFPRVLQFPEFSTLNLAPWRPSTAIPKTLQQCPKLKILFLNNNKTLSNKSLNSLSYLTELRVLSLSKCRKISDLSPLSNLTQLQQLDLYLCISLSNLDPLAACTNLRALNLRTCHEIVDDSLSVLNNTLESLDLSGCEQITDKGLAYLQNQPLQELFLQGCTDLSGSGLKFLKDTPLRRLELGFCPNIASENWAYLGNLSQLTFLSLHYNPQLRDEDLQFLTKLVSLEELHLTFCTGITDASIPLLAKIPRLSVAGTSLSEEGRMLLTFIRNLSGPAPSRTLKRPRSEF